MDIRFACSQCGQHITVEEDAAGAVVNCPGCNQPVSVPAGSGAPAGRPEPPKPIVFRCEHCGQSIEAERANAGLATDCPKCGGKLVVPQVLEGKPVEVEGEEDKVEEEDEEDEMSATLPPPPPAPPAASPPDKRRISFDQIPQGLVHALSFRKIGFLLLGVIGIIVICSILLALAVASRQAETFFLLAFVAAIIAVGLGGVVAGGVAFMACGENEQKGAGMLEALAFCGRRFFSLFSGAVVVLFCLAVAYGMVNGLVLLLNRDAGIGSTLGALLFIPQVIINAVLLLMCFVVVVVPCAIAVEDIGALDGIGRLCTCATRQTGLLLSQWAMALFGLFGFGLIWALVFLLGLALCPALLTNSPIAPVPFEGLASLPLRPSGDTPPDRTAPWVRPRSGAETQPESQPPAPSTPEPSPWDEAARARTEEASPNLSGESLWKRLKPKDVLPGKLWSAGTERSGNGIRVLSFLLIVLAALAYPIVYWICTFTHFYENLLPTLKRQSELAPPST